MDPVSLDCPSRRGVLRTLAGVGVTTIAAGVLSACGGSDAPTGAEGPAATAGAGGTATGGADGTAAGASVPLADVPVGEAVAVDVDGARYVVAQPSEGEVVAFSASCTHAGTTVEAAGGLELRCPNHGSRFDAADGAAVLNGPAEEPLPSVGARVEGDQVVLDV
ncbi:Rieske (2Fe-2S) protein [Aquipuribacter hungaricus]|uniref:Rieske (2Fe-2S) protein n=1 Tax=Aquipuribacter hungaricus TaxID=545624 RepID=UPI003607E325